MATEMSTAAEKLETEIYANILKIIERQLPKIMGALAPQIIQLVKEKVETNNIQPVTQLLTMTQGEIRAEYDNFVHRNKRVINGKFEEREKLYYTHARYDPYLDLYGECLQEEPVYVPRKFRNDKYYVRNNDGLISVQRFE